MVYPIDNWQIFQGWPPLVGPYGTGSLPPEFRRENQDLRVPLRDDQLMSAANFWRFYP